MIEVPPLGLIGPFHVENLDPIVLPIAHVDPFLRVHPNAVGRSELPGASPGRLPGVQKFALSAKPVDSRVPVPVRLTLLGGLQIDRPRIPEFLVSIVYCEYRRGRSRSLTRSALSPEA